MEPDRERPKPGATTASSARTRPGSARAAAGPATGPTLRRAPSSGVLTVGDVDDPAEAEADRLADLALRSLAAPDDPQQVRTSPGNGRIRRAVASEADTVVRRAPSKGAGWESSTAAKLTGVSWLLGTQASAEQRLTTIQSKHQDLLTKIANAKVAQTKVTSGGAPPNLAKAELTATKWDRAIDWAESETALAELTTAITEIDGVSADLADEHASESEQLTVALGKHLAAALLATMSPKEVTALAGRMGGLDALKRIGQGGLGRPAIDTLLTTLNTDALKITLAPFGGKRLTKLIDDGFPMVELAKSSTFDDVERCVDELSAEALTELAGPTYTAATIVSALLDPLGNLVVENLADTLTAVQVATLLKALTADRVKVMAIKGKVNRIPELDARREPIRQVCVQLGKQDALLIAFWQAVKADDFDKVVKDRKPKDAAALFTQVGVTGLTSLVPTMTKAELDDHATRLTNKGLKGIGEAMTGKDLLSITTPDAGAASATDDLLKELGRSHGDALAAARKNFKDMTTFNLVLEKCAAHLDADGVADFFTTTATHGWKDAAELTLFFNLAGANIAARLATAKLFAAENDGTHPEIAGEANPVGAETQATVDGRIFKAATGDINHVMAGHTYSHFAMTVANAVRATSSLFPTGTKRSDVVAAAKSVLEDPTFTAFVTGRNAGYDSRTINGYTVGVNFAKQRITMMYPNAGTQYGVSEMEAVVHLFKSKK